MALEQQPALAVGARGIESRDRGAVFVRDFQPLGDLEPAVGEDDVTLDRPQRVVGSGVERGPTLSVPGRVSIKRQGTIDTKTEGAEPPFPLPNATCVPPMQAASAPPSTITRCDLFMKLAFRVLGRRGPSGNSYRLSRART